jgi:hypothetical protein
MIMLDWLNRVFGARVSQSSPRKSNRRPGAIVFSGFAFGAPLFPIASAH